MAPEPGARSNRTWGVATCDGTVVACRDPMAKSRARAAASLYGNAPDSCEIALLLVDVINDLQFPGGERLARHARSLARNVAELKVRARLAGIPCIYANDNFGRWRSDFSAQVRHCLGDGVPGAFLASALKPDAHDYFVLKPKHSAFYETCLQVLLEHLGVKTVLLAGIATDSCVTFTANDAHLRGYHLVVLRDGCASIEAKSHRQALAQMERLLRARVTGCSDLRFVCRRGKPGLRLLSPHDRG
jgi:nicotinamidase-related amidase